MKGLVVTRAGGPEVLEWQDVPAPQPAPGEVLLRTIAFAVNWADLLQREGRYPGGAEPPFVSGHDLVGEVVGHGPGVTSPPLGTRLFGVLARSGAAADLVAAPASWLHPVPDGVPDEQAAGLAGPFFTADAAIVTMGRLQPGESVLVHAAAGAYGSAAVQLARAYGAGTVVATAGSDEKVERIREWGADVVVNYTKDDFVPAALDATRGRGVDLLLESVGGDVLSRSFDCVAPAGRLISVGASSGGSSNRMRLQTLFEKGISVGGFTLGLWIQHQPALVAASAARVLDVVTRRAVVPVVGGVFPADRVGDAHAFLAGRRSIGRTVVLMDPLAERSAV